MEQKILKKNEIEKLYNEFASEYNVYAPTNKKGNISFEKIEKSEDIVLDYLNSKIPPKSVLFPQMEVLFEYTLEEKDVEITDRQDLDQKILIFGIRPCDAYSFELFANFFSSHGNFKDEIYLKKKENTTLIGIGCNTPRSTCFCTSVEGNPFNKENMDVFLTDLGDTYLVEGISDKGKEIVKKMSWLSDATEGDVKKSTELAKQAEESITSKIDSKTIVENLETNFEHPVWEEISESCIGCGSCSYMCPTCTCFDVIDETDQYNNRGRRVRIWDTCQSCLYSLETSGHNPRDTKIQRCRNRIMHKFSYYPENYELLGCVGCGRCIAVCPANNDILTILHKVEKIEEKRG
ncbi:MAG: 4Fe-4S dicluster domain-containing protein [Candidatus Hodarchaeales archaeon]|jgi:ferredoxin